MPISLESYELTLERSLHKFNRVAREADTQRARDVAWQVADVLSRALRLARSYRGARDKMVARKYLRQGLVDLSAQEYRDELVTRDRRLRYFHHVRSTLFYTCARKLD